MTTRITLTPLVASMIATPQQPETSVVPHGDTAVSLPLATHLPQPVRQSHALQPLPVEAAPRTGMLAHFLRLGRQYHPLCRNAFMEKRVLGYYHYERRVEFSTCAVAAAYAGAFGSQSVERPDFSYSMALWRLSQKTGYDLNHMQVNGPTGRRQSVAKEMMHLIDKDYWTREGVAEWLESLKL